MFVDEAEIFVRAGRGGDGAVSFHREKYRPKGGPDGGDGGRGGDVLLVVDPQMASLIDFEHRRQFVAENGRPGGPNFRRGRNGRSVKIRVPPGTVVYDADTGEQLADLTAPGAVYVPAWGGIGGRGNAAFKSPSFQAPKFAERGEPGEQRRLRLELKLLADIGLVGFPNAGKSSLLARVSRARPKIAPYPFTTLTPVLGVYAIEEGESFVIADIPGLIEGAHAGAGLGHAFLRHIERTKLLIHIVDVSRIERPDPLDDFRKINAELRAFNEQLARLPQIVALNKIDLLPNGVEDVADIRRELERQGFEAHAISAATGEGVEGLMRSAAALVREMRAKEPAPPEPEPPRRRRPVRPISVTREPDGTFVVSGSEPERAVVMTDLSNPAALLFLHKRLTEMGVMDELERLGAQEGDTVRIGDVELAYVTAADVYED